MKVVYKEIFKLKVMLDKANIPYEFLDRSLITEKFERPFYQIIVCNPHEDNVEDPIRLISVIQGVGTYGADQDLLEIQGCLTKREGKEDSVKGYLTATNVFMRIKKNYNYKGYTKGDK